MHLHPRKEVDLVRKVKYVSNVMSDIDEKKIDQYGTMLNFLTRAF